MSANIIDNDLIISEVFTSGYTKIFIDTLSNYNNIYSAEDAKHTLVVTEFTEINDEVHINLDLLYGIDLSAFTINIDNTLVFYFSRQELYYKQVELLTSSCSTCLDKEQKEKMVLFMMKSGLLDFAERNELVEDSIRYYIDLARMVGIDLELNALNIQQSCNNTSVLCYGNTCLICRD